MATTSSSSKTNQYGLIPALLILLIPLALTGREIQGYGISGEEDASVHELDPYTVVGTRISGIDLEGTLPVLKLDKVTIEATGYTQMDEVVRSLPMLAGDGINDLIAAQKEILGE